MPSGTFHSLKDVCFQRLKERLTVLSRADTNDDFKLKSMRNYHSENLEAPQNYTKLTLPVFYK